MKNKKKYSKAKVSNCFLFKSWCLSWDFFIFSGKPTAVLRWFWFALTNNWSLTAVFSDSTNILCHLVCPQSYFNEVFLYSLLTTLKYSDLNDVSLLWSTVITSLMNETQRNGAMKDWGDGFISLWIVKKKKSHLKKSCRPAIANLSGAEIHFCRWTIKMKYTNTTLRDCHFLRSCDKNDWRETTAVFCSYLLCGRACEEGRDAARAVKGRGEGDKWPCRRAEFNGPAVTFTHISNRKLHGCSGKKARQE